MNLEHLRTPNPLNEFDYAAVRARVHSKLAERRRWWWLFRFASAFAATVLVMLSLIPVDPAVPSPGLRPPSPRTRGEGRSQLASVESPSPRVRGEGARRVDEGRRHRPRRHKRIEPAAVTAASRIEIHTADPDIRIIWIVPKENS